MFPESNPNQEDLNGIVSSGIKDLSSGTGWVLFHCFTSLLSEIKYISVQGKKASSLKSKQDLNMEMMFHLKNLVYH